MAMDVDDNGKESLITKAKVVNGRGVVSKKAKGKKVKAEQVESVDCTCSKGDDGSPMIHCSMCKIWCVLLPFPVFQCQLFAVGQR